MSLELTGKQRRYLRGLAHPLKPVVQVGVKGLSEAALTQINDQLEIHELIKVKMGRECPTSKDDASRLIEKALKAGVAQIIGRTLVVYRAREEKPDIVLPKE